MRARHLFALLLALTPASPVFAVPSFSSQAYQQPHLAEQYQDQIPLRIWPRLRDAVIETLWPPPNHNRKPVDERPSDTHSSAPASLQARYGEDVVLRFTIKDPSDTEVLREASNILFLDVWAFTDEWVDIRLAKDVIPSLLGLLPPSLRNSHAPLIHNLAQAVYESYPSPASRYHDSRPRRPFSPSIDSSPDVTNLFFKDYQPYSVILPWMRLMASMFSTHVTMVNVGSSYEGREIPALRIGIHPANSEQQPPFGSRNTIVIVGGAHAREWISTSTVTYVAYSLITGYGKLKHISRLVEEFDWILIPTLNPDGYVYTWETDRLWRKNRQETSLPFCHGVDLDRSWGFQWSGQDTMSNPCSESYAGDGPFGGQESKLLADWALNEVETNNVNFIGFLDLHSYSQQILYPYAFSCLSVPPTLENLEELAMGLSKAIRQTAKEHYDVSSACEGLIAADTKNKNQGQKTHLRMESTGGSALDWFYHELQVRYSYQIKLRDKGSYGFLLPKDNIIPTGKEVLNAILVFGKFMIGADAAGLDWEVDLQPDEDEDPIATDIGNFTSEDPEALEAPELAADDSDAQSDYDYEEDGLEFSQAMIKDPY